MAKEKQSKKTKQTGTEAVLQRYEVASCNDNISRSSNRAFKLYLRNGLEEEIETVKLLEQRFSENENSIYNIKYMVVYLQTNNDDKLKINTVINVVRRKHNCRFPVVFRICEKGQNGIRQNKSFSSYLTQTYGKKEFLRTYGLGQFLYSEKAGCFLLPESESKSQTKTAGPTPSSESSDSPTGEGNTNASVGQQTPDHDRIIKEFMKTQHLLDDLQMEHLKMYVRPANIIPRLRHDSDRAKNENELNSFRTQVERLLQKEGISLDVQEEEIKPIITQRNIEDNSDSTSENESVRNDESSQESNKQKEDEALKHHIEEFKHMCDVAEEKLLEKQKDKLNGRSTGTPIYALLLDDRCEDNDIQEFIKKAEKKGIHIIPTANVAEAEKELLTLEYLKHHLAETENKNDDKDPRYTVILVDLLLKEKHTAPSDLYSGTESLIVSRRQGYDFVRDLARMGRQYGVILLSTLPRNFKTMVAGSLPLRTRNFPYKDGGKLAIPEYQQLLIDMIVEAHDENNEEAIFRAFTKRGFAMHYIRYMNNKSDDFNENKDNEKAKTAICDFLHSVEYCGLLNWGFYQKDKKNSSSLTKENKKDVLYGLTSALSPVLNKTDLDEEVDGFLNNLYNLCWEEYMSLKCPSDISEDVKKKIATKCLTQYDDKETIAPLITDFIEQCYTHSSLSFATTLNLFKQKEELRDFVTRLQTYKNIKDTPQPKKLQKRFVARRLALFLFFWANLSKTAAEIYVNQTVNQTTKDNKNQDHTLTPADCVKQILDQKGLTPSDYHLSQNNVTTSGLWLYSIEFTDKKNPECPYMTPAERKFFLNLFQEECFKFELKENDEQLNAVLNTLNGQNERPTMMCSELIYYFKQKRTED